MIKSQIRTQLSAFLVVIPYYLSLRYNNACEIELQRHVVIPYYLSLRYNSTVKIQGEGTSCNSLLSLAKV